MVGGGRRVGGVAAEAVVGLWMRRMPFDEADLLMEILAPPLMALMTNQEWESAMRETEN